MKAVSRLTLDVGTDTSQGKGQIISNINACQAVQATIKSTLGPYGGDLLMVDENGRQTITNDGATVMKVRFIDIPFLFLIKPLKPCSSSILYTLLPESSSISQDHKMLKSVTERHL